MYWGKIIGTLAGLATLKPWFALLGLFLGHQVDRFLVAQFQSFDRHSSPSGRLPDDYLRPLFQTMGHLAKIDGRVSEQEIRAARAIMHRLGLGPAQVRNAINWFDEGKQAAFPLLQTVRQLRRAAARRAELRLMFVRLLLEVVLAKERMHQKERAVIWSVCTELDIGRVELAQLEAMIRAQRGFRHSPAGDADAQRVKQAYQTLGVAESATNDEVKKAYRRAMNKSHPDKIASRNPDDAVVAEAHKRTREVRGAYEMLKARRSIR
ncbi:MAG: co-chaperone DjlA [Gammaproteobacteria bacterium]|nr:co-chaperone DjlA [Gammaproteobacteria bacterium]MDH3431213.1 co-chaperone DjlA [Gammaproteobacteria bacterium]